MNLIATRNLLLVFMCLCASGSYGNTLPLRIGLLFTKDACCTYLSMEDKASAMTIAVDALYRNGVWDNNTVTVSFTNKHTEIESSGVANVVDLVLNEKVDVIFGSPSSRITIPAAHLTRMWNVPHVTWSGVSFELGMKEKYQTLVRTVGPISDVGRALASLFLKNHWTIIAMLYRDDAICQYCATGIKDAFPDFNITIMQNIAIPLSMEMDTATINDYLRLVKQTSRIIFLCDTVLRPLLVHACKMGMCNGEYLFIFTTLTLGIEWEIGDSDDAIVRKALDYLIVVTIALWKNEIGRQRLEEFQHEVIDRMPLPPWNMTGGVVAGYNAQHLYDAMYLYGLWVNHTLANNVDLHDGRLWLEFAKNTSFDSISGPCDIGSNGDRLPYFWFQQWRDDIRDLQTVAVSENRNTKITETLGFKWYTADGLPPKDSPDCGFFGEFCVVEEEDNTTAVLLASVGAFFVLAGILVVGFVIRRRKLEEELLQSVWKVKIDEIELQMSRTTFGSKMVAKSQGGLSQISIETEYSGRDRPALTALAMLKGRLVAVRTINKIGVLAKEDLHSLKTMREMAHDNINPFLGACFETSSPCVMFLYCSKGSLQDILENDEIALDTGFKQSLTMDLVQGLQYIHNSKLGFHGRLKSSNCLVDNRWMLKITDYGLSRFVPQFKESDQDVNEKYKDMLWTAPEILANPSLFPRGSREGDVYGFGIILHEIFFRMGPFAGHESMTAKDVTGLVKNRALPLCRPVIFNDAQDVTLTVTKLMQLCWHDNEADRPSVHVIRSYIKKNIQRGNSVNIVDVILQRLEKYASNLEDLVDQRTQQLVQEKQKSDRLLYRMLPKTCAEKLKLGEQVIPEIFESATVFFSDIVGFTTISSKSSPIQVVDLLNDLYICFDAIIGIYDAYKVETIGDAYLVVSGIPTRNESLHAGVIADMSLDILEAVGKFRIKHLPSEVCRVRIGNHTGSCCAGIVGLSMPRYCLFGDTVNTASRMESSGEANKVHLSEATHLALHKLGGYCTSFRAIMDIKGKGEMKTYWLEGRENNFSGNTMTTKLDNL